MGRAVRWTDAREQPDSAVKHDETFRIIEDLYRELQYFEAQERALAVPPVDWARKVLREHKANLNTFFQYHYLSLYSTFNAKTRWLNSRATARLQCEQQAANEHRRWLNRVFSDEFMPSLASLTRVEAKERAAIGRKSSAVPFGSPQPQGAAADGSSTQPVHDDPRPKTQDAPGPQENAQARPSTLFKKVRWENSETNDGWSYVCEVETLFGPAFVASQEQASDDFSCAARAMTYLDGGKEAIVPWPTPIELVSALGYGMCPVFSFLGQAFPPSKDEMVGVISDVHPMHAVLLTFDEDRAFDYACKCTRPSRPLVYPSPEAAPASQRTPEPEPITPPPEVPARPSDPETGLINILPDVDDDILFTTPYRSYNNNALGGGKVKKTAQEERAEIQGRDLYRFVHQSNRTVCSDIPTWCVTPEQRQHWEFGLKVHDKELRAVQQLSDAAVTYKAYHRLRLLCLTTLDKDGSPHFISPALVAIGARCADREKFLTWLENRDYAGTSNALEHWNLDEFQTLALFAKETGFSPQSSSLPQKRKDPGPTETTTFANAVDAALRPKTTAPPPPAIPTLKSEPVATATPKPASQQRPAQPPIVKAPPRDSAAQFWQTPYCTRKTCDSKALATASAAYTAPPRREPLHGSALEKLYQAATLPRQLKLKPQQFLSARRDTILSMLGVRMPPPPVYYQGIGLGLAKLAAAREAQMERQRLQIELAPSTAPDVRRSVITSEDAFAGEYPKQQPTFPGAPRRSTKTLSDAQTVTVSCCYYEGDLEPSECADFVTRALGGAGRVAAAPSPAVLRNIARLTPAGLFLTHDKSNNCAKYVFHGVTGRPLRGPQTLRNLFREFLRCRTVPREVIVYSHGSNGFLNSCVVNVCPPDPCVSGRAIAVYIPDDAEAHAFLVHTNGEDVPRPQPDAYGGVVWSAADRVRRIVPKPFQFGCFTPRGWQPHFGVVRGQRNRVPNVSAIDVFDRRGGVEALRPGQRRALVWVAGVGALLGLAGAYLLIRGDVRFHLSWRQLLPTPDAKTPPFDMDHVPALLTNRPPARWHTDYLGKCIHFLRESTRGRSTWRYSALNFLTRINRVVEDPSPNAFVTPFRSRQALVVPPFDKTVGCATTLRESVRSWLSTFSYPVFSTSTIRKEVGHLPPRASMLLQSLFPVQRTQGLSVTALSAVCFAWVWSALTPKHHPTYAVWTTHATAVPVGLTLPAYTTRDSLAHYAATGSVEDDISVAGTLCTVDSVVATSRARLPANVLALLDGVPILPDMSTTAVQSYISLINSLCLAHVPRIALSQAQVNTLTTIVEHVSMSACDVQRSARNHIMVARAHKVPHLQRGAALRLDDRGQETEFLDVEVMGGGEAPRPDYNRRAHESDPKAVECLPVVVDDGTACFADSECAEMAPPEAKAGTISTCATCGKDAKATEGAMSVFCRTCLRESTCQKTRLGLRCGHPLRYGKCGRCDDTTTRAIIERAALGAPGPILAHPVPVPTFTMVPVTCVKHIHGNPDSVPPPPVTRLSTSVAGVPTTMVGPTVNRVRLGAPKTNPSAKRLGRGPTLVGIGTPVSPMVANNDSHTNKATVVGRLSAFAPDPLPGSWAAFTAFVDAHWDILLPNFRAPCALTKPRSPAGIKMMRNWANTFSPRAKADKKHAAINSFLARGVTRDDLVLKAMPKNELLQSAASNLKKPSVAPNVSTLRGDENLDNRSGLACRRMLRFYPTNVVDVLFGPDTCIAYKTLSRVWSGDHFLRQGAGRTNLEVGDFFKRGFFSDIDSWIGRDFSLFDNSHGAEAHAFFFHVMHRAGFYQAREHAEIFAQIFPQKVVWPKMGTFELSKGMASGAVWTTLMNTIIDALISVYVIQKEWRAVHGGTFLDFLRATRYRAAFAGDDSATMGYGLLPFEAACVQALRELGYTVKSQIAQSCAQLGFLGCTPARCVDPSGKEVVTMVPLPHRFLTTLGWALAPPKDPAKHAAAVAFGWHAAVGHIPFYGELLRAQMGCNPDPALLSAEWKRLSQGWAEYCPAAVRGRHVMLASTALTLGDLSVAWSVPVNTILQAASDAAAVPTVPAYLGTPPIHAIMRGSVDV